MKNSINVVTLSIGQEYSEYTKTLVDSFLKAPIGVKSFSIVTNTPENFSEMEKYLTRRGVGLYIRKIDPKEPIAVGRYFNYNLKRLAISLGYEVAESGEYIMWLDSDSVFIPEYVEDFDGAVDLVSGDICVATRPAQIGYLKQQKSPMVDHKIEVFGLRHNDKYDDAHCINEQILIVKKTDKIEKFLSCWEKMSRVCEWFQTETHAEGIEMGVSLKEAGLTPEFPRLRCIAFYSNKTGRFFSYG